MKVPYGQTLIKYSKTKKKRHFVKTINFDRLSQRSYFAIIKEIFETNLPWLKRIKMIVEVLSVPVWAFRPEMEIPCEGGYNDRYSEETDN